MPHEATCKSDGALLKVDGLTKYYGERVGCVDVSFALWPGGVLAVVGESGSGKTTPLNTVTQRLPFGAGRVSYRMRDGVMRDLATLSEAKTRFLARTDWGFVHQNPAKGLRMGVSVGGNISARLIAVGERHYGRIRQSATDWLTRVEVAGDRIDDAPRTFSGSMQIRRNLVTGPRLVFMDEPTGGLDASVQARALDVMRRLVSKLQLAAILVTRDLGVARLLADGMMIMKDGRVVEEGSPSGSWKTRSIPIGSFWFRRSTPSEPTSTKGKP